MLGSEECTGVFSKSLPERLRQRIWDEGKGLLKRKRKHELEMNVSLNESESQDGLCVTKLRCRQQVVITKDMYAKVALSPREERVKVKSA